MANAIQFLKENFWHVAPLLVAAGIGLAIMIERFRALVLSYPLRNPSTFYEKVRDLVMTDRVADAITLCEKYKSKPMARVVKEGLLRAHQPENLISDGLEIAVSEAHGRISNRTPYLATIANVATLLGLFGTIAGLIQSFEAVGNASPQQKAALLAAGISTAMNATMLGLAVAIPCMIAFAYLMNRTNQLNQQVEQSAVRILDMIKQRYYEAETGSSEQRKAG
jgi:biopolymer transport protein ExbB/TolQ